MQLKMKTGRTLTKKEEIAFCSRRMNLLVVVVAVVAVVAVVLKFESKNRND